MKEKDKLKQIQLELPLPTEEEWRRYEDWAKSNDEDSKSPTEQDLNDSYKIEFEI